MGFSTLDAVISAACSGQMYRQGYSALCATAATGQTPKSLWTATGSGKSAGASGTLGKANGRTLDKTSTGAYYYSNSKSPGTMSLIGLSGISNTATSVGSLILVDRMADCQLSNAETTGAITGLDGTARMASTTAPGDGGQIWCEVTSGFSAANNVITFAGTDQLGNTAVTLAGMTTTSAQSADNTAGGISTTAAPNGLWQGLASGVTSVRALTNVTLTSGTATGQYNACIVRPLGYIPLITVSTYFERDLVAEIPNIPHLFDSTCLMFIYCAAAGNTPTVWGEFKICTN